MKCLLLSDIHGAAGRLRQVLDFYRSERCDMLLLLGDLLNYGPRNGLPDDLDPQAVAAMLNQLSGDIVAVRGNCDSEVDQMLLRFPIMADYAIVADGKRRLFITHGHLYRPDNTTEWSHDIFVSGHTHHWLLEHDGRRTVCNTGSPTFPKDGLEPTFALYDNGTMSIRRLDGTVVASL